MTARMRPPVLSVRILPSALTVAAICLGLSAVKFALDHRPTEAMALLAGAAILDALDGRAARMLKATSRMGEEIDSLADAVNFGVAPAFIVYATLLQQSRVGWIVVLVYAVCIVLRLARFNAMLHADGPAYEKNYFTGMPAPAAAIGAIGPIAAKLQFPGPWWDTHWAEAAVIVWIIGVSLLAVSAIPMRKVHTFAVSPNMVVPLLALLAILVAASIQYGYVVIMVIIVAYVIHIPFAVRTKGWLAKHPEVWEDKPKEQRQARRAIRRQARRQPHRRSAQRLGLRRPGATPRDGTGPRDTR
jgi:CDP-diacylglycerol---serine O-phosphatidyltransferase